MAVIDASVYVALVNAGEKAHAVSWAWFEHTRVTNQPVVAPAILIPEVAAAISRGVGDMALANRIVGQLKGAGVIELLPVSLALAERAAEIAAGHRIRGCDAVYIAVAEQLGEPLVTLDRQQLERAAAIVEVIGPAA
jgi:predicted nucleic acid-binding protein